MLRVGVVGPDFAFLLVEDHYRVVAKETEPLLKSIKAYCFFKHMFIPEDVSELTALAVEILDADGFLILSYDEMVVNQVRKALFKDEHRRKSQGVVSQLKHPLVVLVRFASLM